MRLTSATRVCAVLGDPVEHSRSPQMHNAAYRELGLDRCYVAFRVPPARLPAALEGLPALGLDGANITIPHKVAAAARCHVLTDEARAAGAVNTVVVQPDGRLLGALTDGLGLVDAVREVAADALGGPVTLLGTGGTAQAAGAALLAAGVPRLAIAGRRPDAAAALARRLAPLAPAAVVEGGGLPPGGRLGLLVHCTPVGGLTAVEDLPLPADEIRRVDALADFAYRPDGSPTPLVAAAAAARVPVVDGLELLVRQGTRSFELLTGVAAPVAVMRAAARASTGGAGA